MRRFSITKDKSEEAARDREIPNPAITGDNLESSRRQNDVYFRALIEHACDIISTFDAHGIRLYTSPSIERVLGYTSEEMIGQSGFDLIHPDDRKHFSELFAQVVSAPGSVLTKEIRCRHKDGTWRILESTASNLLNEPAVASVVLNSRDVTRRKAAEDELRLIQEHTESVLASVADIHIVYDREWKYIYANEAALRSIGLPPEQIIGRTLWELYPDIIGTEIDRQYHRAMEERVDIAFEFHYLTDDTWWENRFYPTPEGLAVFATEVTQRKKAESALRQTEQKYRDIFENAGEGIFQTTPEGQYIAANPALARMYGFESADELITSCRDISRQIYADPARRDQFKRLMAEHGVVRGFEVQIIRKDGAKFWVSVNARAVRDSQGAIIYYEGTSQDIDDWKRAEARSAAFATLARKLSGARTPVEAGRIIAETAGELFGWDAINLDLYDADHDLIHPMLNIDTIGGVPEDISPTVSATAPTSRSRRVINEGPQLILRNEPIRFDPEAIPFGDRERPSASLMSVPIQHGKKIVGLLSIQSYAPGAYDHAALKDLQALAEHCGETLNRIHAEESLRESEERFRQMSENFEDVMWLTDRKVEKVLYINPAYERIFGRSCESLRERLTSFIDAVHPDDREKVEQMLERQRNGKHAPFEYRIIKPDGSVRWILRRTFPIRNQDGEIYLVAGIGQDITERKRAQEELHQSEERYRELFENSKDALYVHDLEGRYIAMNRAAERLVGYTREEVIGKSFTDFIAPEYLQTVRENMSKKLGGQSETTYEIEMVARGGHRVPVEVSSRLILEEGRPVGVQGTARDITERRRAERERASAAKVLQRFSRRLIEVQENDRQHIARELHDQIGQILTAVKLNLESVRRSCRTDSCIPNIEESIIVMDEAFQRVRELSLDLRPSLLDDLGLTSALRWYVNRYAQRSGIAVQIVSQLENDRRLSRELETACFRITQEALANVARHAKANKVEIRLERVNREISLTIKDNGIGFDAQKLFRTDSSIAALGLRGMEERALAVRGRLEVLSTSAVGTEVRAQFPIPPDSF